MYLKVGCSVDTGELQFGLPEVGKEQQDELNRCHFQLSLDLSLNGQLRLPSGVEHWLPTRQE